MGGVDLGLTSSEWVEVHSTCSSVHSVLKNGCSSIRRMETTYNGIFMLYLRKTFSIHLNMGGIFIVVL